MDFMKSNHRFNIPALALIFIVLLTASAAAQFENRGDLDLDGTPFEIEDAIIFADYFKIGLPAFIIDPELQIAATDINMDGLPLTVADYVMMIRICMTETDPPTPPTDTINGSLQTFVTDGEYLIRTYVEGEPTNLYLQYDIQGTGAVTVTPIWTSALDADLQVVQTDQTLIIILRNLENLNITPFTRNDLISIQFTGEEPTAEGQGGYTTADEMISFTTTTGPIKGDINLNQVPFEIADQILLGNYMTGGIASYTVNPEMQLLASDINEDSTVDVTDYEHFLNVTDDIMQPDDPSGPQSMAWLTRRECFNVATYGIQHGFDFSPENIAAVRIKFYAPNIGSYTVSSPLDGIAGITLNFALADDTLAVMLFSFSQDVIDGTFKELIEITWDGAPPNAVVIEGATPAAGPIVYDDYFIGDANLDKQVNIGDVIWMINYVFVGDLAQQYHLYLMDVNYDGAVNIGDPVYMVNHIFNGGAGPGCPGLIK